jgi:TorA maturation chaperone TorD
MSASFKIPTSLKGKAKKDPELPKFEWKLFEKEKKLGCGTFGSVYLEKYKGKPEKWLPKRIMSSQLTRNPVS